MKLFLKKYKHGLVLIYGVIYMVWFMALESRTDVSFYKVHIFLDNYVPFHELFIIPYYIWFGYIAVVLVYFFFKDTREFYKTAAFLISGMTICLIIYTIWPNGQDLRPATFARDNLFVDWVKLLYRTDTSTNVCPSIHVFNSIGVHIAISNSVHLKNRQWLKVSSFVLMILICLSTVSLKQHSVLDGICAVVLASCLYPLIYYFDLEKLFLRKRKTVQTDN